MRYRLSLLSIQSAQPLLRSDNLGSTFGLAERHTVRLALRMTLPSLDLKKHSLVHSFTRHVIRLLIADNISSLNYFCNVWSSIVVQQNHFSLSYYWTFLVQCTIQID